MIEQHGKGVFTFFGAASGALLAWLPTIDVLVRIGSGVAAIIAGIYSALYFRKRWKGEK